MGAQAGDGHAGFQASKIALDDPILLGARAHAGEEAEDGLVGMGRAGVRVLRPLRRDGYRGEVHEGEREFELAQQKLGSAGVEIGWGSG